MMSGVAPAPNTHQSGCSYSLEEHGFRGAQFYPNVFVVEVIEELRRRWQSSSVACKRFLDAVHLSGTFRNYFY